MTVLNNADELRAALSTTATDHSFYLEPGSVMALGGTALTVDGGNFSLSSDGEGAVIDAESLSRCVEVTSGYLRLINIHLTNGKASRDGGGMRVAGAEVHLVNTTISHCRVEGLNRDYGTSNTGGGISFRSGRLTLESSSVLDCTVLGTSFWGTNSGGGIFHDHGDLRLYRSRIERCHVHATVSGHSASGGAYKAGGARDIFALFTAEWYDSMISDCSVTSYNGQAEGGAASIGGYFNPGIIPRFVRCTITGCQAIARADAEPPPSAQGGALCVKGADNDPIQETGFVVEDSAIEDCEAIGINAVASGGAAYLSSDHSATLIMRNSTLSHCRANGTIALGGAIAQDHPTSLVEIYSTLIEHCEAYSQGNVAAGGAMHVRWGQLLLAQGTSMRHNFLTDVRGGHNHTGAALYVGAAVVIYLLPTPAAHWLQAIYCEKVYNPCPDYCLDACTLPGEATDNPDCTLTLYAHQPCPWQYEDHLGASNGWEHLLGSWVQTIPPGALDHTEFPMPCVQGYYATPGDVLAQADSNCGGPCPEGRYCPNAATTEPLECPQGMYCPLGSSVPLPVPAGTSWNGVGLARASEATTVASGYYSSAGQVEPTPCGAAAFFCPGDGNSVPQIVRAGHISIPADGDPRTRTAEAPCPSGHWCSNGVAIACQQGFYSNLSLPVEERTAQSACAACPLHMTTTMLGAASEEQCVCESGRVVLAEANDRVLECGCPAGTVYSYAAGTCMSCIERTWSHAGSTECSMCAEGYYRESAAIAVSTAACLPCPRGARCRVNSTLQTFGLLEGYWRLETTSPEPLACDDVDKITEGSRSVCQAGSAKGNCTFGHAGPLCSVCTEDDHYFDEGDNICKDCPGAGGVSGIYAGIFVGLLLTGAFLWMVLTRPPRCLEPLQKLLVSLSLYLGSLGLQPKLKMALSFYQVVTVMDSTYGVELPDSYKQWMKHFAFVGQLDWASITIPKGCLFPGGFRQSLIFQAVAPLIVIGGFVFLGLVTAVVQGCLHGCKRQEDDRDDEGILRRILRRGVILAMPPCILTTFIFVPSVSASIFAAWSCEAYDLSETEQVYYLRDDYAVICYDSEEHREIRRIAYGLMAVWPIGMVLLYILLLVPVAKPLTQRRSSALTKATAFLWRDYEVDYFWWEPLELLRRTALTGWVLLLPEKKRFLRLVTGLLISLLSSFGLLLSKPFRRDEDDMLSILCQVLLVCVYLGALLVDNFNNFVDVGSSIKPDDPESFAARYLGFSSSTNIVTLMITFSVTVVILAASSAVWRMWREGLVATFRLIKTKSYPETGFGKKIRFHLFLSHTWSDCQDSAAVIKRQLQRLVPGASIFLDVDDLADISKLEEYISQSAVVLLMLSRGYFASRNCMREVEQSVKMKKRLILLHEADVGHGGAPLSQLKAMCPEEFREDVFAPQNLLVQWHRVSIFQLETLKVIAEQMLLEMPRYKSELELPLFAPHSMMSKVHSFETPVVVYTSPFNPGAAEVASEMSSVFNAAEGLHGDKMIEQARTGDGYFAAIKAAAQASHDESQTPRRSSAIGHNKASAPAAARVAANVAVVSSAGDDDLEGSTSIQATVSTPRSAQPSTARATPRGTVTATPRGNATATKRGSVALPANLKFRFTSVQPAEIAEAIQAEAKKALSSAFSLRRLSVGVSVPGLGSPAKQHTLADYHSNTRVKHDRHGEGTVIGLGEGRLQVAFDNGDSHRYASHSLAKLKILSGTIAEECESERSSQGVACMEVPSPAAGGGIGHGLAPIGHDLAHLGHDIAHGLTHHHGSEYVVKMVKTPLGLGLTLDPNNRVTALATDSQATRSGTIRLGDQVVSLNGKALSVRLSFAEVLGRLAMGEALEVGLQRPGAAKAATPDGPSQPTPTHFLLYLSKRTFTGGAGLELSHEVRAAMQAKLEIVMMHETAEPDGCEFDEVISHTPADLLEKGLYGQLATPLHAGLHRAVSLLMAAKAMGATAKASSLVEERGRVAAKKVAALKKRANPKQMVQARFVRLTSRRSSSTMGTMMVTEHTHFESKSPGQLATSTTADRSPIAASEVELKDSAS